MNNLYIASSEQHAGSLVITIGMMELMKSRVEKIAFFRPLIDEAVDPDTDFILRHFQLDQTLQESYALTCAEAELLLAQEKEDRLLERLLERYHALSRRFDFVLIEGLNHTRFDKALEQRLNLLIAKNLQAPYISILNGYKKDIEQIIHEMCIEDSAIRHENVEHLAVFVNRLNKEIHKALHNTPSEHPFLSFFLRNIPELDMPSMGEIKDALHCTQILGEPMDLDRIVRRPKIAAMNVDHLLERIEEGDLIIVPGDRSDIILSVLSAHNAKEFPNIAGILLTGGYLPSETFLRLIQGFKGIPVLAISSDTFDSMERVTQISASIQPERERKISLAIGEFMRAINSDKLMQRLSMSHPSAITPQMFTYTLYERSRKNKKRIVLPESSDERILRAAEIILRRGAAEIILLGDEESIGHETAKLGLDLSEASIINPHTSTLMQDYIEEFYTRRAHKGLTLNAAKDALSHPTYFATMMVHKGDADGMVSGAIHTTQDTIRPALQIIKTSPDMSLVSSLFFMCMETHILVYADCAINQDPNAEELAQIAIASAKSARMFGIEPRVAMLSYSTGTSGFGSDVDKVREATEIVRQRCSDLVIEGPIQYDAAIDPDVARIKLPMSPVAGKANVFIFPDLNTGNNTYKAVQRSSGAIAIGPILQGLKKPINDLSRGCSVTDIVNTILITAIQAQEIV